MKTEVKHKPAFATLHAQIEAGEELIGESDAMASMSGNTGITAEFNGGFFKAILLRLFGGESLFVNRFRTKDETPAEVVLTGNTPGDMVGVQLQNSALLIQPGSFIACTADVALSVGWAGFASWIGGEGLFRLKLSGTGTVWLGAYGSIFEKQIAEEYVVDSSHIVAYEPTIQLRVGLAGGIFSSFFSGEGLVSRAQGPGKVYLQSRSMSALTDWTNHHLF